MENPQVSFAKTLFMEWPSVKARNATSRNVLDELIRCLRGRIAVEEMYSKGLQKLSNPISSSSYSLNEAIVGFTSDIANKSVQHKELAENLQKDVLEELQALRDDVYKMGKHSSQVTSSLSSKLKTAEQAYKRSHKSFERAYNEATMHCISLGSSDPELVASLNEKVQKAILESEKNQEEQHESKTFNLKKSAMHSLGMPSPTKDLVNWLLPSDSHKKHTTVEAAVQHLLNTEHARLACLKAWNTLDKVHRNCVLDMQILLNDVQAIEERVIFECQDMLRKHIVLESSCFANLQYDIQMLFGVMESVSVEGDLGAYIDEVSALSRQQKIAAHVEEIKNVEKSVEGATKDLEEMEGGDSVKDGTREDGGKGEDDDQEKREKKDEDKDAGGDGVEGAGQDVTAPDSAMVSLPLPAHNSLFNSISSNIPLPPPKSIVDIPTIAGSPVPVDEKALAEFWAWQDESNERFRGMEEAIEKEQKGQQQSDGEGGEEEQSKPGGKEKEGREEDEATFQNLVLASRVGKVLDSALKIIREEEEAELEKQRELEEIKEKKRQEAASPPLRTESSNSVGSDTAPDFGAIPSLPTPSAPSAPASKPPMPVKPANRRMFPSITALQSKDQTMLLATMTQHHLKLDGSEETVDVDGALSGATAGFNTLFFARQAMDVLLRKSKLNELPYNSPALVKPENLLKANQSFEKMLGLIAQSPNDPVSPKLLRDILISSCLIGTEVGELSEAIDEDKEKYACVSEHVQKLVKEKAIDRTCMLRHLLGATKAEHFTGGKLPLKGTFVAATQGMCSLSNIPEHMLIGETEGDGVSEEGVGGKAGKGQGGNEVNIVVGQVAFVAWILYNCGVSGPVIKKGIADALAGVKGNYAGVDAIIGTSLELGSRMRDRSSSGVFNSSSGEKYGSTGGAKAGWEKVVEEEEGDGVVENFKSVLQQAGSGEFGF